MTLRLLLADDHAIILQGLRSLVAEAADLEIVAEAGDGRSAVRLARQHHPDIVLMDVEMPELNGIEATRQIVAEVPGCAVIVLSMHSERRMVLETLRAGARGYLIKDCLFEELLTAVRGVAAGQTYLGAQVAGLVVTQALTGLQPSDDEPGFSTLTPREREIVQLLAEGHSTKETAARLFISTKTVETHRKNILDKLGIGSIAELTKWAIREGLIPLG